MTKEEKREERRNIIRECGGSREQLLRILLNLQEYSGRQYVDEESASLVAEELKLPLSSIYEALTFYSMLHTEPSAQYIIQICDSAPCHFNHSSTVKVWLEQILDIRMGACTPDGIFSLQSTTCVGACDRGPVMKIGETVYGDLTEEKIRKILGGLRTGVKGGEDGER